MEAINCTDSELSTFLLGLGEGYLPICYWDTSQSGQLKLNHIAKRFSSNGKETVSFPGFQYLMMSPLLTEGGTRDSPTSCAAGSPSLVRTCPPPEKAQESRESDPAFGKRWSESSVRYDLDSSSWKTHRCLFEEALPLSSVTLPKWGLMLNGVVYQRRIVERPISGTGYGFLPTPTESMGGSNKSASPGASVRPSSETMARKNLWPTPVSDDCVNRKRGKYNSRGEPKLSAAVKLFPTPQARDYKDTGPSQGNRKSPNLGKRGTPRASAGMKNKLLDIDEGHNCRARLEDQVAQSDGAGGMLNPTWVEWLMDWPTEWTGLRPLETARFHQWLRQHGEFSEVQ